LKAPLPTSVGTNKNEGEGGPKKEGTQESIKGKRCYGTPSSTPRHREFPFEEEGQSSRKLSGVMEGLAHRARVFIRALVEMGGLGPWVLCVWPPRRHGYISEPEIPLITKRKLTGASEEEMKYKQKKNQKKKRKNTEPKRLRNRGNNHQPSLLRGTWSAGKERRWAGLRKTFTANCNDSNQGKI